jgi:hypothetical protein
MYRSINYEKINKCVSCMDTCSCCICVVPLRALGGTQSFEEGLRYEAIVWNVSLVCMNVI